MNNNNTELANCQYIKLHLANYIKEGDSLFGDNLKQILKQRGITQKSLAEYVGVKPTTVHDWIYQGNSPKIEHLCRISEYLNISIDELINKDGDPQNKVTVINESLLNRAEPALSIDEETLLDNYRDMTKDGKRKAQKSIKDIREEHKEPRGKSSNSDQGNEQEKRPYKTSDVG